LVLSRTSAHHQHRQQKTLSEDWVCCCCCWRARVVRQKIHFRASFAVPMSRRLQ